MISIAKPKLNTCWFCEKPKSAAAQSSGRAVCAQCDGFMSQGVICIGVRAPLGADTIIDKIYRDGNWCVLSRNEFEKRFGDVPAQRFTFITPDKWQKAHLPRFGKHGASHLNDAPAAEDWSKEEEVIDAEEETIAEEANSVG